MKIIKYLHSCLIIEEQGKTFLIDPGQYTYDAKIFPLETIPNIDHILISHEHLDHFSLPFVKEVLTKFPNLSIITNESVCSLLEKETIEATTEGNDYIIVQPVPHEDIVFATPPLNVMFTLFGKFSDPGDSHHFSTTASILALPIQAPWGSFADAIKLAEAISPQYVIPIHDWHWKDEVRKGMYQHAAEYLQQSDIIFKGLETGEIIEIQ
jgi:L-ascorbate metabolism protein UlaG (beta-lactamase superfamily)